MLRVPNRSLAFAVGFGLVVALVTPVVAQANSGVAGPDQSVGTGPSTQLPVTQLPITPPLVHPEPTTGVVLKVGSRGKAVLTLEKRVHVLRPDRIFDRGTAQRVKQIQRWSKLPRTGAVDTVTNRAISAWDRSRAGRSVAAQVVTTRNLNSIIAAARQFSGRPYVAGGAGPNVFDCSGFTRYVVEQAMGRSLPHQSAQQASVVHRISSSQAKPGDLVFFTHGGHVYHVGIYAGNGRLYHASRPGTRSGLGPIFSSSHFFGRVA